jgi:hypothetical protein
MTIALTRPRVTRPLRRQERRRGAEHDLRVAQLAALHEVRAVLDHARDVVDAGWIRNGWVTYDDDGRVGGTCLVGAVVLGGGGLAAMQTQPVQRALDVAWHALARDPGEPVRWCPAPPVRLAHIRELARWNDDPARRASEVSDLLTRAGELTSAEAGCLRLS